MCLWGDWIWGHYVMNMQLGAWGWLESLRRYDWKCILVPGSSLLSVLLGSHGVSIFPPSGPSLCRFALEPTNHGLNPLKASFPLILDDQYFVTEKWLMQKEIRCCHSDSLLGSAHSTVCFWVAERLTCTLGTEKARSRGILPGWGNHRGEEISLSVVKEKRKKQPPHSVGLVLCPQVKYQAKAWQQIHLPWQGVQVTCRWTLLSPGRWLPQGEGRSWLKFHGPTAAVTLGKWWLLRGHFLIHEIGIIRVICEGFFFFWHGFCEN